MLVEICRFSLPLGVWEGLRFVIVTLPGLFSYLFFSDFRYVLVSFYFTVHTNIPNFFYYVYIFLTSRVKLHIHLLNMVVQFIVFLTLSTLICRGTDISKCFIESLGIRDNESRLYINLLNVSWILKCLFLKQYGAFKPVILLFVYIKLLIPPPSHTQTPQGGANFDTRDLNLNNLSRGLLDKATSQIR